MKIKTFVIRFIEGWKNATSSQNSILSKDLSIPVQDVQYPWYSNLNPSDNSKIDIVLVCPIINLEDFFSAQSATSKKSRNSFYKKLKQGALPGVHLLNKPPLDMTGPVMKRSATKKEKKNLIKLIKIIRSIERNSLRKGNKN